MASLRSALWPRPSRRRPWNRRRSGRRGRGGYSYLALASASPESGQGVDRSADTPRPGHRRTNRTENTGILVEPECRLSVFGEEPSIGKGEDGHDAAELRVIGERLVRADRAEPVGVLREP